MVTNRGINLYASSSDRKKKGKKVSEINEATDARKSLAEDS